MTRMIASAVLVVLVGAGIRLGAGGDIRMRIFTGVLFGLCALSLAWKLWAGRGERDRGIAEPPAPETAAGADPPPAPESAAIAGAPPASEAGEALPARPWRVYGYDRFSYEDYFVGAFETEEEAREVVRQKLEGLAKFQDASLRDDIWVEPPHSKYRIDL